MATPYTGNSIVDYLSSQGQDASIGNRSKIYSTSGLKLGNYSGTAEQNTALLSYLRSSVTPAATPTNSPAPTVSPTAVSAPASTTARTDLVNSLTSNLVSTNNANMEKVNTSRQALIDYYAGLEDPMSRYTKLREGNGLPQQEELVNTLTTRAMDTDKLIGDTETSVNTRSKDFLMNDADRTALVGREQAPLLKAYTDILKSKERAEVGLAGKQQLVQQLLNLSLQGDEMRAKPLELGVDYTTKDAEVARTLLSDVMGLKVTAGMADIASTESKAAASQSNQWAIDLENLRTKNDISKSLATKSADKAETNKEKQTTDTWNQILGQSKTEYDAWKYINDNQDALAKSGVDVAALWQKHNALKAKVGQDGAIRSNSTMSEDSILQGIK